MIAEAVIDGVAEETGPAGIRAAVAAVAVAAPPIGIELEERHCELAALRLDRQALDFEAES